MEEDQELLDNIENKEKQPTTNDIINEQDYAERFKQRLELLATAVRKNGGLEKAFAALQMLEGLANDTGKTISEVSEDLSIARTLTQAIANEPTHIRTGLSKKCPDVPLRIMFDDSTVHFNMILSNKLVESITSIAEWKHLTENEVVRDLLEKAISHTHES